MKFGTLLLISVAIVFAIIGTLSAADIVPNEIQQPGTQPGEIGNLESPDKCDNCHGGYNSAVEPAFNWRGSTGNAATVNLSAIPDFSTD